MLFTILWELVVVRIIEPFPGLVPPCLGLANGAHLDTIELWTYTLGAIHPSEINKAVRFRVE